MIIRSPFLALFFFDVVRSQSNGVPPGRSNLPDDSYIGRPTELVEEQPAWFKLIKCGNAYEVYHEGYLQFDLPHTNDSTCTLEFFGSRMGDCTPQMYCKSLVTAPRRVGGKQCSENGYFQAYDGLGGRFVQCGDKAKKFNLIPSKGGRDLFVKLKGVHGGSCQVFCNEDLPFFPFISSAKPPKTLPSGGSKMERKQDPGCLCGVKNPEMRVVGGKNANPFEFPWMAAIVFSEKLSKTSNRTSICGATLITDSHAISAAHCFVNTFLGPEDVELLFHAHVMDPPRFFDPEKLKDIPGIDRERASDAQEGSIRAAIKKVAIHPLYDAEELDYDVAILHLAKPVSLKEPNRLRPICLPQEGNFMDYQEPQFIEVTGWGHIKEDGDAGSRILQKVKVPIVNHPTCVRQIWQATDGQMQVGYRHICAGYEEGQKDACQGDSGGPAIYQFDEEKSQHVLAGIVSAGLGCARPQAPGFYSNIDEMIAWIYHETRSALWCKDE